MNKRLITALIIAAAASLAISADAVSAGLLSPGLRHYSEDMCMIRSSLTSRPVTFSKKDFELALGCPQETITITALPPVSEGTLYYGDMPAAVNQVFNMSGIATNIAIIECGMPTAALSAILAVKFSSDAKTAMGAVAVATLLSIVTIPFIVWLL